jgi:tetratricopeptide (TPR) repeat protein
MSKQTEQPRCTQAPPRSRRLALGALLVLLAAAAGGGAWVWWRWSAPVPPEIALEGCEPAVVRAVEAARQQVIQEPRSGQAWGHLGQVLLAHYLYEPAAACCANAEQFDPKNPRWPYYQGLVKVQREPAAAAPLLQKAADLCDVSKPYNPTPRLRLAEVLLQLDRPEEARSEFQHVLERQPGNPRAQFGLGQVAAAEDDQETALRCFANCSRHSQTRKKAATEVAKILRRRGQDAAADKLERQARSLPPDLPWPDAYASEFGDLGVSTEGRLQRAKVLEMADRFPQAIRILEETVRDAPSYRAYVALGLAKLKTRDYAGAEEALRQARQLGPDQFEAIHLLGALRVEQARLTWAHPEQRPQAMDLYRQAAELARQAVAIKPEDALGQMFLGLALKPLGQRKEALAAFRTAIRCAPDKPDPYLHLAEALAEDGDKDEARRVLQEGCRLVPSEDPRLRQALERLGQGAAKP